MKHRILVVDDDPLIRRLFGRSLERADYDVTLAGSGAEAFLELGRRSFELVLTDLVMDPIDGLAVLRKAKELNPETQVIIVTGHGNLETAIDALRLDADDYILKPCEPEVLLFRTSRCIEKLEDRRKLHIYENLLPVCCVCGSIRDDEGRQPGTGPWMPVEKYMEVKSGCEVTSAYCPSCAEKIKQELGEGQQNNN
jgi:DNA-binding response OmpR family regulator